MSRLHLGTAFCAILLCSCTYTNASIRGSLQHGEEANILNEQDGGHNRRLQQLSKGKFDIKLIDMGNSTSKLARVIKLAARRWEHVIQGELPNEAAVPDFDWFNNRFETKYSGKVDDVVIGYLFEEIDGPGGILGRAAPLQYRGDKHAGNYSTISGYMIFDSSDILRLDEGDQEAIMTHEIGHILGIGGASKSVCARACKPPQPGVANHTIDFPYYNHTKCPNAGTQAVMMGLLDNAEELRMETKGAKGSACVHIEDLSPDSSWSDVMTARFNREKEQLITRVDLGALMDLGGYQDVMLDFADKPIDFRHLENMEDNNNTAPHLKVHSSFVLYHSPEDYDDTVYIENLI